MSKKTLTKLFFFLKSVYIIINHPFKDLYDKIYTIGHYSGFCSSLNDENCANGGHFELSIKRWSKQIILTMHTPIYLVYNPWFQTLQIYLMEWSFTSKIERCIWCMHGYYYLFTSSFDGQFKMATICTIFIVQRAAKAWIIANGVDFII